MLKDDQVKPEIIVHVYREMQPVAELPVDSAPEAVVEIGRVIDAWHRGESPLLLIGYAFILCDHRDDGPSDHMAAVHETEVAHERTASDGDG